MDLFTFLTQQHDAVRQAASQQQAAAAPPPLVQALGALRRSLLSRAGADPPSAAQVTARLHQAILQVAAAQDRPLSPDEHRDLTAALLAGISEASRGWARAQQARAGHEALERYSFLAHDLRSPLHAAVLGLELARRQASGPSPALREVSGALAELHERLTATVSAWRLLAVSEPALARVRLRPLVEDVASEVEDVARTRGVSLRLEVPQDFELQADEGQLRAAVRSLLDNAARYSRPGRRVTVRALREGSRAVVEVEDGCEGYPATGPGSAAPEAEDSSPPEGRDANGFRLGLRLALHAAELHGGSLERRDVAGRGCTFRLALPVRGLSSLGALRPYAPGGEAVADD